MSKGRRPKKNNNPAATTRDVEDGGVITDSTDTCWDFALVDKTAAANKVKEGDPAIGSIQGKRVLVRVDAKPLGYAPSDVSQLMIDAARKQSARLTGKVTSEGSKNADVWIRLCLS